jgi:hypothetical protein
MRPAQGTVGSVRINSFLPFRAAMLHDIMIGRAARRDRHVRPQSKDSALPPVRQNLGGVFQRGRKFG